MGKQRITAQMQRGFHQSCTVIQVFTCIKLHVGPSTGPRARAPAPGPSDRQACCGHWCQSVLYLLGGVGRSVWVLVTGFTCAYLARGPLVLRSRVVLVVFVCLFSFKRRRPTTATKQRMALRGAPVVKVLQADAASSRKT